LTSFILALCKLGDAAALLLCRVNETRTVELFCELEKVLMQECEVVDDVRILKPMFKQRLAANSKALVITDIGLSRSPTFTTARPQDHYILCMLLFISLFFLKALSSFYIGHQLTFSEHFHMM